MLPRRLELENEVWNLDRCSGCGMCVAACSRGRLSFENGNSHPSFIPKEKIVGLSTIEVDTCSFCDGMCAESCPRLKEWDTNEIHSLMSAKTTRSTNSNPVNEVISDLLIAGIINDYIDSALVMDIDRWTGKPFSHIVRSIDEILQAAGNQGIWAPILSHIYKDILKYDLKKIAIVGPPCVSRAINRVTQSAVEGLSTLKNAITLSISTFCTGFYKSSLLDELSDRLKVPPNELTSIRRSEKQNKIQVKMSSGKVEEFPLEEMQKHLRKGCARCTDFLGEHSDLSIGEVGSKEGFSTLISWTPKGFNFIRNCVSYGLIESNEDVDKNQLVKIRSDKERRERVQDFDSLLVYSLESLSDHNRIEEAKQRFNDLFTLKKTKNQISINSSCGGCNGC